MSDVFYLLANSSLLFPDHVWRTSHRCLGSALLNHNSRQVFLAYYSGRWLQVFKLRWRLNTFKQTCSSPSNLKNQREVRIALLGSWSNHDEDENDIVKKELVLRAKQQLCTCITLFSTFLWRPLHDYDVKPANATFYGGRKHTTTNFPFFLWTYSLRIHLQKKSPKLSWSK